MTTKRNCSVQILCSPKKKKLQKIPQSQINPHQRRTWRTLSVRHTHTHTHAHTNTYAHTHTRTWARYQRASPHPGIGPGAPTDRERERVSTSLGQVGTGSSPAYSRRSRSFAKATLTHVRACRPFLSPYRSLCVCSLAQVER